MSIWEDRGIEGGGRNFQLIPEIRDFTVTVLVRNRNRFEPEPAQPEPVRTGTGLNRNRLEPKPFDAIENLTEPGV